MAVLKGEGRVPILFGSLPLPIPPNRSAYLARPDVAGAFATVVIVPDESGITPTVKMLARHLARHGYAVFAPAVRDGVAEATADVADAIAGARMPGTEWADGGRLAVIGLGEGAIPASIAAAGHDADSLVLIGGSLDRDLLAASSGSLLVLRGESDDAAPADEVKAIRDDLSRGEFVLYRGVGARFFDDASDQHDPGAAADTLERVVGFLDARFGAVQPA